jgi:hypothetical protein
MAVPASPVMNARIVMDAIRPDPAAPSNFPLSEFR